MSKGERAEKPQIPKANLGIVRLLLHCVGRLLLLIPTWRMAREGLCLHRFFF